MQIKPQLIAKSDTILGLPTFAMRQEDGTVDIKGHGWQNVECNQQVHYPCFSQTPTYKYTNCHNWMMFLTIKTLNKSIYPQDLFCQLVR